MDARLPALLLMLLVAGSVRATGDPATPPSPATPGQEAPATTPRPSDAWSPDTRVVLLNAGVLGFIGAWGATHWDYGGNGWQAADEGWFGQATDEGGADKAGHLYTGYVLGRSLTGAFRHFGYDERKAQWAGAASSLAAMTFMEIGDGYSPYGFSGEDQVMNVAGAGLAWLLAANPALDRTFALRGEYRVHADHAADVLTDYDRWRYYATLKLDGFARMPRALRWVELHAGYFTRGYGDDDPGNDRRYGFVGVGLSLTKLAKESGWQRTGVFLDYFQPPDTVLRDDGRR